MSNRDLNKKIKSYSALAGSIALMGSQADAQVIYTDINPDSTVVTGGDFYNLDLDNGGVFDFTFTLNIGTSSSYTSQQVAVTPAGSNGIAGDTVGAYVYPFAFNAGDTIKSTLQFNFGSSQSMASYFGPGNIYGNFIGTADKFIGLQFYIGTQMHYGWARFTIDATASEFMIKDYAYNATPNAYILAGEMPLGIAENSLASTTSVFSSNKNIHIHFLTNDAVSANIRISNAVGQTLQTTNVTNKENVLDLSKEASGIYFVTITRENIVYTKKVFLR